MYNDKYEIFRQQRVHLDHFHDPFRDPIRHEGLCEDMKMRRERCGCQNGGMDLAKTPWHRLKIMKVHGELGVLCHLTQPLKQWLDAGNVRI